MKRERERRERESLAFDRSCRGEGATLPTQVSIGSRGSVRLSVTALSSQIRLSNSEKKKSFKQKRKNFTRILATEEKNSRLRMKEISALKKRRERKGVVRNNKKAAKVSQRKTCNWRRKIKRT